jgi:Type III secretion protein (HpaP)
MTNRLPLPLAPSAADAEEQARRRRAEGLAAQDSARRFDLILRVAQRPDAPRRGSRERTARPIADARDAMASAGAKSLPPPPLARGDLECGDATGRMPGAEPTDAADPGLDPRAARAARIQAHRAQPQPPHEDDAANARACGAPVEPPADKTFHDIASRITAMYDPASGGPETWFVTLPMDAQALPETVLRIAASRTWMRLRFSTQSGRTVRILMAHMPALTRMLEHRLRMPGQIDVDLE